MPSYLKVEMLESTFYPDAGGRLQEGQVLNLEESLANRWDYLGVCEILGEPAAKPKRGRPVNASALAPDDLEEDEIEKDEKQQIADHGLPLEEKPLLKPPYQPKKTSKGNFGSSISRAGVNGDED